MTLAAEQAKATKRLVYFLFIELGHRIESDVWTQELAPNVNVWWADHLAEGAPSRVRECARATHTRATYLGPADGIATLADCQAAAGSWFYDSVAGRIKIHTSGGDSPATAGAYYVESHFWKYFCTKQYRAPYEFVFNGQWCDPRLEKSSIPEVSQEVSPFSEGGIKESYGSIRINNGDGAYDASLGHHTWEAAPMILKAGSRGDGWADLVPVWKGWSGNPLWDRSAFTLDQWDERRIAE